MASAKQYSHVTKGGNYELVGTSTGAGGRKGDVVQVYRDIYSGKVFHREPEDFSMRMKPAKSNTEAQLLAALEAVLPLADFEDEEQHEVILAARAAISAAKGAV